MLPARHCACFFLGLVLSCSINQSPSITFRHYFSSYAILPSFFLESVQPYKYPPDASLGAGTRPQSGRPEVGGVALFRFACLCSYEHRTAFLSTLNCSGSYPSPLTPQCSPFTHYHPALLRVYLSVPSFLHNSRLGRSFLKIAELFLSVMRRIGDIRAFQTRFACVTRASDASKHASRWKFWMSFRDFLLFYGLCYNSWVVSW